MRSRAGSKVFGHELALRPYLEVARELEKRIGWRVSAVRVQQICKKAERKIRAALGNADSPQRH